MISIFFFADQVEIVFSQSGVNLSGSFMDIIYRARIKAATMRKFAFVILTDAFVQFLCFNF